MINDIIEVLESQSEIYKKLIKYSEQMKNAIVKDNIQEINILIQAESALAMKFSVLEKRRLVLIKRLADSYNYQGDNFNIDDLKRIADLEQTYKLMSLESEMEDIIIKLSDLNDVNGKLIKNRLDVINFSLNYLGITNDNMYSKKKQQTQSKLVDESI